MFQSVSPSFFWQILLYHEILRNEGEFFNYFRYVIDQDHFFSESK
ncbi:hypothetical protein D2M30_3787 [Bacillus amyloliquefaciens]|nr:hypothetical protein D2M30_3787 [Bacillus amyloliquefaciens]